MILQSYLSSTTLANVNANANTYLECVDALAAFIEVIHEMHADKLGSGLSENGCGI